MFEEVNEYRVQECSFGNLVKCKSRLWENVEGCLHDYPAYKQAIESNRSDRISGFICERKYFTHLKAETRQKCDRNHCFSVVEKREKAKGKNVI